MDNILVNSLPDGDFKVEITLSGGTGRTTVKSPANVHIENGVITAEIVWSSPNYDLMIVGDKEYKPISNDGGSVFMVQIPALDTPLNIKAETVAMSAPHLIDYTITVSGAEILKSESSSSAVSSTSAVSLTSEEIQSMLESFVNESTSGTGSVAAVLNIDVESPKSTQFPPLAIVGISAALGAAVAFVAVSVGKKKKK